jgi:hypothetical protein
MRASGAITPRDCAWPVCPNRRCDQHSLLREARFGRRYTSHTCARPLFVALLDTHMGEWRTPYADPDAMTHKWRPRSRTLWRPKLTSTDVTEQPRSLRPVPIGQLEQWRAPEELQPLHRQPIPAEDRGERATSTLPAGLFAALRESAPGPQPRWRSPELAAGCWGSSAAAVAPGPQGDKGQPTRRISALGAIAPGPRQRAAPVPHRGRTKPRRACQMATGVVVGSAVILAPASSPPLGPKAEPDAHRAPYVDPHRASGGTKA